MDYLAHAIWSYIFFHRTKKPWLAVIFGLLPDSLSWAIYLFYRLFTSGFQMMRPPFETPAWLDVLYGISHSYITIILVFLIVFLIFKQIPIYMYAWPVAVTMDVFTHSLEMFPTPFLWPFKVYFDGISWGTPWFMILNYSLIVISFVIIFVYKLKKKRKKKVK